MAVRYYNAELEIQPTSQTANRRSHARYQCALATPGTVQTAPQYADAKGWVVDLSKLGAGLLLECKLPERASVVLHVSFSRNTPSRAIPATVMHNSEMYSGEWSVGILFDNELSSDELDDLLA